MKPDKAKRKFVGGGKLDGKTKEILLPGNKYYVPYLTDKGRMVFDIYRYNEVLDVMEFSENTTPAADLPEGTYPIRRERAVAKSRKYC